MDAEITQVSERVSPLLDDLSSALPTATQAWNPSSPNSFQSVSSARPIPGESGSRSPDPAPRRLAGREA